MPFDVVFVGAGPANLAGALHLANLVKRHNAEGGTLGEVEIAVIEKGPEIGAHGLSGAVMDPKALAELIPDFLERGCPVEAPVGDDAVLFLTEKGKFKLPVTPPPMVNHGYYVVSLAKLLRWMAPVCEEAGVNVFPEFPGVSLLYEGHQVVGVRTGDKGIDKNGEAKENFEPGVDLKAKVVVLGEGPRGTLAKQLTARMNLDRRSDPQVYALGVKEVWELPDDRLAPGTVYHTMGYPLPGETFGGGFIYMMKNRMLDVGLVTGLDYRDPQTDPHHEFQRFKNHPWVRSLLEGARLVGYGAKAIPEGGYYSVPRLYTGGCVIVGDSGGLLNGQKLKGVHIAMKSGMLAAEAIAAALAAGRTGDVLSDYADGWRRSWLYDDLYKVRNVKPGLKWGTLRGTAHGGVHMWLNDVGLGALVPWTLRHHAPDHATLQPASASVRIDYPKPDGVFTFDRLSSVYLSNTNHEENQPSHLRLRDPAVPVTVNLARYDGPEARYCPAGVYEFVAPDGGTPRLQINAQNCVHCKTCDIKDPTQNIHWVPPEGGGGPNYVDM